MDRRDAGLITVICVGGVTIIIFCGWACIQGTRRLRVLRKQDEEKCVGINPPSVYRRPPLRL